MEDVAADEHDFGRELDDLVNGARKRQRNVRLALIDSARSYPLVLAVAEMQVGKMDEAQVRRSRDGCGKDCNRLGRLALGVLNR